MSDKKRSIFGTTKIVCEERWIDKDHVALGGYSIDYDINGIEESSTEWHQTGVMYWPKNEYKPTFWQRLFPWIT